MKKVGFFFVYSLFVIFGDSILLRCGLNYNIAKNNCESTCLTVLDCNTNEYCWIIAVYDDLCPQDSSSVSVSPTLSPTIATPLPTMGTPSPTNITPSPVMFVAAPTQATPSPTVLTPLPTVGTPSPTQETPSPTIGTPSPTPVTLSPTVVTPMPVSASISNGSPTPCPTNLPYRCGINWSDANSKCGTCCAYNEDCVTGEYCYNGVSDAPCQSAPEPTLPTLSPVLQPTNATPNPTSITPAPISQPTLPTPIPTTQPTLSPVSGNIQTIMSCGNGKYVSLTFDDGPTFANQATQTIINKLNDAGIKATFYLSPAGFGNGATQLSQRCALVQQLVNAGHDIQSHSWSHPYFSTLTNEQISTELTTVSDWIYQCSGNQIRPTIFRPPYGDLTKNQAIYINSLGYKIGLWNLDSNDWRSPNNYNVISGYINVANFNSKSINILVHDRNIYDIIDQIILLFDNGYTFITQTECYNFCDTLDSYGICRDPTGYTHYAVSNWGL